MRAMILAFESPDDFAKRDLKGAAFADYMAPWRAYVDDLTRAGVMRGGGALQAPAMATTVSIKNGRRCVADGPFADAREQLGGYFIVETTTLDDAARWGARCPSAKTGRVEVRAIPDYGQGE